MNLDLMSYLLGKKNGRKDGEGHITINETSEYTFSDPNNDGNIVITEVEGDE